MITSMNLEVDLTDYDVGYIVGDYPLGSKEFKVYIPRLMANIKKSNPTIYIPTNYNRTRYINDESCRSKTSAKVYAKNYLTATLENNSGLDRFAVDGIIKDGTKVMCRYRNGLLSHITINTSTL